MASSSNVLAELSSHLQKVSEDPATPLDTALLEQCEILTNTPQYRDQTWKVTSPLFLQIASLLPTLQQNPSPLTHFVMKLAGPYRFDDIKDIDLETGLDLQAAPFHSLVLSLLEKATFSSIDAQALANRPTVVSSVVRLWLCTQDAGVATQAEDLLTLLLSVSPNEPVAVSSGAHVPLHTYGTGPMWRRLFRDGDISSLYYHYTSLKQLSSSPPPCLNKRDKTIAQARLLSWLPRIGAMDFDTIVSPLGVDAEREVGIKEGQGLLHYASLKMVDTEDDMLMHTTLLNFYSTLITTVKTKPHLTHYDSSLSLDFMKQEGIHKGVVDFHTSAKPGLETSFLSGPTAQYISDYALHYPENFEASSEMPVIRNYVHRNLRQCEAKDLNILAAMPRSTLVPHLSSGFAWDECVLLEIPITRTNPEALKTLATVFHGPPKEDITFPQTERVGSDLKRYTTEASFARLLTALYHSKNPTLFADLTTHMDTIAIKETALAALSLIHALITSTWSTQLPPTLIPANDPIHTCLDNFPPSGLDLILDPTISGGVFPCLLKPATSFTGLVGGHGDAENAAYQVAAAKFHLLQTLGAVLEKDGGGGSGGRQGILAMVRQRVSEGVWGVGGTVGSRIGTMEL